MIVLLLLLLSTHLSWWLMQRLVEPTHEAANACQSPVARKDWGVVAQRVYRLDHLWYKIGLACHGYQHVSRQKAPHSELLNVAVT